MTILQQDQPLAASRVAITGTLVARLTTAFVTEVVDVKQKPLLPATWTVPDVFRDRLGESAGRQRAMFEDQHLLLVLHAPPGPDDEKREGRFFWRKQDGSWASTTGATGQMALDAHLAEYDEILDALDEREERAHSADDYFELMRQLNPIVRATRNLHTALQQAREMVRDDKRIINFRDQAYSLERRAELLASDTKNTLEYAIARRSEEQAAAGEKMAVAAHRLNLMAAFFFPLATLSAIFGVNLRHGLEPERFDSLWPFVSVTATGLLAGCVLALYLTRRK
jgi:hypothetical protein